MFTISVSFTQNLTFYGFLPALSQTGRISDKFNYNVFLSTTINAFDSKWNGINYPATGLQLYVQPSIIYVHSANLNFSGSYTYQRNNPWNHLSTNENRFWEQMIFSHPLKQGRMTHRFRYEQRFIQKNHFSPAFPMSTRLRYQLGFMMPLQGKTLDENEFYMNVYNELYFSLTGFRNAVYSENWTYAGFGYNLGKMGRLEIGYLCQSFVRNGNHDYRYLQLCQLMWATNFNFKTKK